LWDAQTGRLQAVISHALCARCVAFSKDGRLLAAGFDRPGPGPVASMVRLWDVGPAK
jgi:hypothetical protein